jgi:hypothetical protein
VSKPEGIEIHPERCKLASIADSRHSKCNTLSISSARNRIHVLRNEVLSLKLHFLALSSRLDPTADFGSR